MCEGAAVAAVRAGRLELVGGSVRAFDECLWCTQAAAPAWLAKTGLPLGAHPSLALALHSGRCAGLAGGDGPAAGCALSP